MLNLNGIVANWKNDRTKVVNVDLLFRALSSPLGGLIEDHHALVFEFADGDHFTAEYGDAGINLLYSNKSRPNIRAYHNIMGKPEAKIEVYRINEVFKGFANIKLCDIFEAIDKIQTEFRATDYSALNNNCQNFVKEILFNLNDGEYPFFVKLMSSVPAGGPMSYYDNEEYTRGGYKLPHLNEYYTGYWDMTDKKFVEKSSCLIL